MQPYIELNAHHIGKSHVLNGLSCEDYSLTYSDNQISVIAVSDGHGDKNCFRSAAGAKCACEIAIHNCRQFVKMTSHIDDVTQCDFESLVLSLESQIADMWKTKVLLDVVERPFTIEEIAGASQQAQESYRNGQRLEKAYGCTLIVALATERFWLAFQIGDGKCVAAYQDGVFVEPIPADENCIGNHSTSLCNSNAKQSFRHFYSNFRPLAVFVSSDGVEESFDQAGLFNCFYSVAYWVKAEGLEGAKLRLEDLLPQISEGGSGDDVSLATMVSMNETISKPRQSLEQVYEKVTSCANVLEQYHMHLTDAKERLQESEKYISELEMEITKLREAMQEKEQTFEQALNENNILRKTFDDLSEKVQRTSDQMEKATKFRETAERFWFEKLNLVGLEPPESSKEVFVSPIEQPEPKEDNQTVQTFTPEDDSADTLPANPQDMLNVAETQGATSSHPVECIQTHEQIENTVISVNSDSPLPSHADSTEKLDIVDQETSLPPSYPGVLEPTEQPEASEKKTWFRKLTGF